jgi:hypothetical protein
MSRNAQGACRYCVRSRRRRKIEPRQYGGLWYDAVAARAKAESEEVHEVPVEELEGWGLHLPEAKVYFWSFWADMDWKHVDHVTLGAPIIFVTTPSGSLALIDGFHRVSKARLTGQKTISVVLLDEAASNDIRTDARRGGR